MNPNDISSQREPWSPTDNWPAGWYTDPWQADRERRWSGTAWTAETRGAIGPTIDGLGGLGGPPPAAPAGPPPEATPEVDAPAPPPTTRPRKRVFALVAVLAVVALIAGFAFTYVADDSSAKSTSATLPPAPQTPRAGSSPGGSSGAPQSPDPNANVVQQLVLRQSDVKRPNTVVLSDGGESVAAAPTLDLCNGVYPSESLRTARLQVDEIDGSGNQVLSTEAVLYRDATSTAQAFSELRSVVAHCPSTPVSSPVGEPRVTTKFNAPPDSSWAKVPSVERQAYAFTVTDASGTSTPGLAVYLRRGRALVGIYFATPNGKRPSVAGNTTASAIVNHFAQRLASVPASAIGA